MELSLQLLLILDLHISVEAILGYETFFADICLRFFVMLCFQNSPTPLLFSYPILQFYLLCFMQMIRTYNYPRCSLLSTFSYRVEFIFHYSLSYKCKTSGGFLMSALVKAFLVALVY